MAVDVFGRDFTQWSRAFNWFVSHIIGHFAYLLMDNLKYWSRFFPDFADSIGKKLGEKYDLHFDEPFRVVGFYDCTVIGTCRPGGGPAEPGIGAARWTHLLQIAFYNGWKKKHGLKWLSLEAPNGMCMFLFGPMAFHHSDIDLLVGSDLNQKLADNCLYDGQTASYFQTKAPELEEYFAI